MKKEINTFSSMSLIMMIKGSKIWANSVLSLKVLTANVKENKAIALLKKQWIMTRLWIRIAVISKVAKKSCIKAKLLT